jgi:hypothetical protein
MMALSPTPRTLYSITPEPTALTVAIVEIDKRNKSVVNTPYCGHWSENPLNSSPITVRINDDGSVFASVPPEHIKTDHTAASTQKTLTMFRVFYKILGGDVNALNNLVPEPIIDAANRLESTFFQDGNPKTWGDLIAYTWKQSDNGLAEVLAAYQPNNFLPESFEKMASQSGDNLQRFLSDTTTTDLSKVLVFNGSGHPDGVEGGSANYPPAYISTLCLKSYNSSSPPPRQGRVDIAEYAKALWQLANTPQGLAFVRWLEAHNVKSPILPQSAAKTGTDGYTTGIVVFEPNLNAVKVTVQLGEGGYRAQATPHSLGVVHSPFSLSFLNATWFLER